MGILYGFLRHLQLMFNLLFNAQRGNILNNRAEYMVYSSPRITTHPSNFLTIFIPDICSAPSPGSLTSGTAIYIANYPGQLHSEK